MTQTPPVGPLSAEGDPRMTDAEASPLHAIQYAVESWQEYGDANDAMTFLDMWQQGDLSESAQYRDWCRSLATPSDQGEDKIMDAEPVGLAKVEGAALAASTTTAPGSDGLETVEEAGMGEILRRQAEDRSRYLNPTHATPASGSDGLETVAWEIAFPGLMQTTPREDLAFEAKHHGREVRELVTREAAEKRIGELEAALEELTENAVLARGHGIKNDPDGIVSSALFDTILNARSVLQALALKEGR